MRLFNPKNTFAVDPVVGGTRVVAEIHLRIGPLERLLETVHAELEQVRHHTDEEGENRKRLVEEIARGEGEYPEVTAT